MRRFETSKGAWFIFVLFSLALAGVEATWPLEEGSPPRVVAAWTWVACSGLVLSWALISCIFPFLRADFWKSRDIPWFLAAHVVPVGLVLFEVNGWQFTKINPESAKEVQGGYIFLTQFADLGIFKMGFLGYPARQYILAAMPSYLFGKGLVAMRIGYGALYALGYIAFLQGTWRYLVSRNSPRPMLVASMAGTLVSLSSYTLLYARNFEQTIVPLAVTCLFLAGLLLLLSRPGPLPAIWVSWALGLLPHSYTPSYGTWAFAMALLGWLLFSRSAGQRLPIAVSLAYGAAAFATSVAMLVHEKALAGKIAFGGFDDLVVNDWLSRMGQGIHATVGLEESLIPAPLLLGVLLVLGHSIRRRDFRALLICAWAAGSVVMALALKGYCWRSPAFDIHRAMFILPVLSLMVALYVSEYWRQLAPGSDERLLKAMIMTATLAMFLNSSYLPFIRRAPRAYEPALVSDEEEATMLVLAKAWPNPKTIYFAPPLDCNLDDLLYYLSPDTKIIRGSPPEGEHVQGNYVISFRSKELAERLPDDLVWHRNRRPYLKLVPE
jgi:hypothetical protein